jgi:PadR family transcriptional regulator
MPVEERYQNRIELLQGTLDLLILQTLLWGPHHGYGLSQSIRLHSGERFQVDTGSLYPALHRLEKQRAIASEWQVSENKQRVKIYSLTVDGRAQLASERTRWSLLLEAMAGILDRGQHGQHGQPEGS